MSSPPVIRGAAPTISARLRAGARVAALTGAGISVASGIPDFRSPGGLYATLRPELLTASAAERALMRAQPTAVVSWSLFEKNQLPYLEVRRPFILGTLSRRWRPTLAHAFFLLLQRRGQLVRLYDQNIDGLSHAAGIGAGSGAGPETGRLVHVHGSLSRVECEVCGATADAGDFARKLESSVKDIYAVAAAPMAASANAAANAAAMSAPAASRPIPCSSCGENAVKPATVLYGRGLPEAFFRARELDFPDCVDVLIIAGTSLTVSPANSLPQCVAKATPRLVINAEAVGEDLGLDFGGGADTGARDGLLLGSCDDGFLFLARECGWLGELRDAAAAMPTPLCDASGAALATAIAADAASRGSGGGGGGRGGTS
jgi:NAD-dependent SIR2 family protein deacetylase